MRHDSTARAHSRAGRSDLGTVWGRANSWRARAIVEVLSGQRPRGLDDAFTGVISVFPPNGFTPTQHSPLPQLPKLALVPAPAAPVSDGVSRHRGMETIERRTTPAAQDDEIPDYRCIRPFTPDAVGDPRRWRRSRHVTTRLSSCLAVCGAELGEEERAPMT